MKGDQLIVTMALSILLTIVMVSAEHAWAERTIPTDGLVLHLPFDEGTGATTFVDSSGSGNNGMSQGASAPISGQPGRFGNAVLFDGVDDHVLVTESVSLDVGNQFTLAAWFNAHDSSKQAPLIEWSDGVDVGVHMWAYVKDSRFDTGANIIDTSLGSHTIGTSDPPLNEWHHVAVSYDNATGMGKVYLDGELATQRGLGMFQPLTSQDVYIGLRPVFTNVDGRMNGLIDEVMIYNRTLSDSEVAGLVPEPTVMTILIVTYLPLMLRRRAK